MKFMWVILFIIINMSIPIISVEALTPWLIGILSTYGVVRVSKKESLSKTRKLGFSILISLLAWGCYYLFYILTRPLGFSGGLIPFIK